LDIVFLLLNTLCTQTDSLIIVNRPREEQEDSDLLFNSVKRFETDDMGMNRPSRLAWISALLLYLSSSLASAMTLYDQDITVNGHSVTLQVPLGLTIEHLASLNGPRFIALGPNNELLIGSDNSNIYRLAPPYSSPETLVSLPGRNHSVTYRSGKLYVAETRALHEADYNGLSTNLDTSDLSEYVALPSTTGGHWSRTVIKGPDDQLYISLGISGNCSDEYLDNSYPFQQRRGGVFKLDESGNNPVLVPFSSGLRNPIGLAFDPATNNLYASNAGPDNLGFDQPREIFTKLAQGSFHGMPWFQFIDGIFQDGQCIDPELSPKAASEATPPDMTFDARSTPQGIAFLTDGRLGGEFAGNAVVAIHGSWARPPGGGNESRRPPKLVMVRFSGSQPIDVEDIVTGFQRNDGSRFARPSGILTGPDGYLYFTSDGGEVQGLFRLRAASTLGDGDITEDGVVDIRDILLGLRYLLGLAELTHTQLQNGDVAPLTSGTPAPDGLFTLGDLLVIQRKALGLISF
jgi:glucose/arabinose dehydrogenase